MKKIAPVIALLALTLIVAAGCAAPPSDADLSAPPQQGVVPAGGT